MASLMKKLLMNSRLVLIVVFLLLTGCGGGSGTFRPAMPAEPLLSADLRQALSELDSLPTPLGIDVSTFASLKAGLRRLLIERGTSKFTSAAPGSQRSEVADLTAVLEGSGARLHWSYRNEGDFNQDSMVNVSDLAIMGIHFGKDDTAANWATAQAADGNANGKVDLPDLVSIGANYLTRVTRYLLQRSDTPDPAGVWVDVVDILSSSSSVPAGQLRQFDFLLAGPLVGYYRVTPCDGPAMGIPGLAAYYSGLPGGPLLSYDERKITLDLIAAKFANLTATTSDGQDAELADYIGTLPHIEAAGFFEGNAWGRFDDEQIAIVCKNHAPASGKGGSALRDALNSNSPNSGDSRRSASGWGVPDSADVDLMWGYGPGTYYTNPVMDLEAILDDAHYSANSGPTSVSSLRNIIDEGVLYIDSPAGLSSNKLGLTEYWIGLDEDFSFVNEDSLSADISAKRVAYMFALDGAGSGKWKYCFGAKFVEQYMSFSPNSLVFLNTPLSGLGTDMIEQFHWAHASLVLGWTANVPNDVSYAGAIHLIDRVLGANTLGRSEDPPIRAFGLQETLFDMQNRGVSAGQQILYPPAPANPYDSLIRFYDVYNPFDAFNLFVPTVEHMVVNYDQDAIGNVLEIYGDFGDSLVKPSVLLGNIWPTVVSFDQSEIICTLPDSGYSSGNLSVFVDSALTISSSDKQLTEWRGSISLSAVGPGTLKHEVIYDLHFRADIDYYRSSPDTSPLLIGASGDGIVPIFSAPDSFATVNSLGTHTSPGGDVTTWTNAGITRVSNVYLGSAEPYMYALGSLDMKTSKFTFFMPCQGPFHEKLVLQDGTISHDDDRLFNLEIAASVSVPDLFEMTLAPDYSIAAGNKQKTIGDITCTAVWSAFPATSIPDPNTPR